MIFGDTVNDRRPALPVVSRLKDIGRVVVVLVAGGADVGGGFVVRRRLDHIKHRPLAQIGRRDILPVFAAVFADLQQAIVGAGPDHTGLMRRFRQRVHRGVMLGAHRIPIDRAAGWLERLRVGFCQVVADLLPALTLVGGAQDLIAADVDDVAVVRREDDRVGPGKAVFFRLRAQAGGTAGPGRDEADLLNAMVIALQAVSAARRAADGADIDDIRIIRTDGDIAAFARADNVAVLPGDRRVAAAARHAQAGIILLRTVDVVGFVAIDIQVIKLSCRLVVYAGKGQAAIQRDAAAAVVAVHHDLIVIGIDPKVVVVAVWRGDLSEVMPAIG